MLVMSPASLLSSLSSLPPPSSLLSSPSSLLSSPSLSPLSLSDTLWITSHTSNLFQPLSRQTSHNYVSFIQSSPFCMTDWSSPFCAGSTEISALKMHRVEQSCQAVSVIITYHMCTYVYIWGKDSSGLVCTYLKGSEKILINNNNRTLHAQWPDPAECVRLYESI